MKAVVNVAKGLCADAPLPARSDARVRPSVNQLSRFVRRGLVLLCWGCWLVAPNALAAERTSQANVQNQAEQANRVRKEFLHVYQHARLGNVPSPPSDALRRYLLWPYVEAALIEKLGHKTNTAVVKAFFARTDLPTTARVRRNFLISAARARDWQSFLKVYDASTTDLTLRCHAWEAGHVRETAERDALVLWDEAERTVPACAAAFKALEQNGALTVERVQARLERAFAARAVDLIPWLISKLPAAQRSAQGLRLQLLRQPTQALKQSADWRDGASKQQWLSETIVAIARREPQSAERWRTITSAHTRYSDEQQQAMWAAIATRAAIDNQPEAAAWLARIPQNVSNAALGEWGVRYQLSRGALAEALTAFQWMPQETLDAPRWRYARARIQQLLGQHEQAKAAFSSLAREAHFHGFLAADAADLPYRVCLRESQATEAARLALQRSNGWRRALELRRLGFPEAALAELKHLRDPVSAERRHALAQLLLEHEWTRMAIEVMSGPEDQQVYGLRFPNPYRELIDTHTQAQKLDPYWVRGLIRAESAFDPRARSHADARGLMQMLPGTARLLSPGKIAPDLYQPVTSVSLGTRYMRLRYDGFGGDVLAATAAYNAGQNAVKRWLPRASRAWPDLWVETIPFLETRDYVARVLAFSVLYDALDGAPVQRLSARIKLRLGPASAQQVAELECAP